MKKMVYVLMHGFSFIFIYYLLLNRTNYKVFSYLMILGIICLNILIFIVDEYEKKLLTEKQNAVIRLKGLEYQKENIEQIKVRHLEIEKRNHDFNKSITMLQDLLGQKKYEEAEKYVSSLAQNNQKYNQYSIYSTNIILNTLLNRKIEQCRQSGIDVKCFVCGKADSIDDVDLYYLFANLLDNAINASEKSAKPYISILINCSDTIIYGEIVNSIKYTEKSTFKEMIPDNFPEGHGYGLLNIYEIIRRNRGEIEYTLVNPELLKVTFNIAKAL